MKVKSMSELQALSAAGKVKVPGMHFVPTGMKPEEMSAILDAVQVAGARSAQAAEANAKAIEALAHSLPKIAQAAPAAARPKRWEFTFERDDDGFTSKVTATAIYE